MTYCLQTFARCLASEEAERISNDDDSYRQVASNVICYDIVRCGRELARTTSVTCISVAE